MGLSVSMSICVSMSVCLTRHTSEKHTLLFHNMGKLLCEQDDRMYISCYQMKYEIISEQRTNKARELMPCKKATLLF